MANELTCRLRKRLPSGFELDAGLRVSLAESPVTVLFGPSGAGKTTLLRMIAGLGLPDAGEIRFREEVWYDSTRGVNRAPQQRRAGFLFQEYALFPHLTVEQNVVYAARRGKGRELLAAFGVEEWASRKPRALSGGQQQRVALARALAAEPALLLLDEPLSALDAAARARTRQDLRRILLASAVPAILVTHDRTEAMILGDWMAVMVDGTIRQTGPVREVFRRPADAQVAESVGMENVLAAEMVGQEDGLAIVQVETARLQCAFPPAGSGELRACIRAEDVTLTRDAGQHSSARNRLAGWVKSVTTEGPLARVELDCGFPLVAMITARSAAEMALREGEPIFAVVKATAVHLVGA